MIYVQLLAVMAVTIFFSTLGSAILASVLGICVFVAGQLSQNVLVADAPRQEPRHRGAVVGRLRVIPNLAAVDVKAGVVGEQTLAWGQIGRLDGVPPRLRGGRAGAGGARLPPQGVLTVFRRALAVLVVRCLCRFRRRLSGRRGRRKRRPTRACSCPLRSSSSTSRRASARSIADAYYLRMVQYYGEHIESGRLESLPAMVDLVTALSPHFMRALPLRRLCPGRRRQAGPQL